jgi:two-component system response regulator PilR (NtrC family)
LPSPSDPRRVLVVDDEADLIATYVRLLERQGYRVVAAGTRVGALTIIERQPIRLVISDVRLPDGNGLDIIRAATAPSRSTPAIVITGFSSEATRLAAFESGASAYFAKPFAAPKLLQTVKELCID